MITKSSKLILICSALIFTVSYAIYNRGDSADKPLATSKNTYVIQANDLINNVQLSGRVMPSEIIDITAATNASINKIHIQPGQQVVKDQLLLELTSDQLDIDLRNAEEIFIKAQIEYEKKQSWNNSDEVFQAKQTNVKNKLNYQRIHETYTQNVLLYKQGIIAHNELQQSEISDKDAKLNLALSERHLKQIINQANETQLNLIKLSFENAKVKFEILQKIKEKLTIRSPIEGIILRASKNDSDNKNTKFLTVGQNVNSGENLLSIGSSNGFAVNVMVNENIIQNVALDQKVNITIPSLKTSRQFEGRISAIDAQPKDNESSNGPPKYSLKVNVDQNLEHDKVFLGMTTKINFNLIEKQNSILIPLASVAYDEHNKPYVLKFDAANNTFSPQQIKLGQTNNEKIEVLAGLNLGETISYKTTT